MWRLGYSLNVYRYLRTSMRDIHPRLGFIATGAFQHAPWNSDRVGYVHYVYGRAYLPGISKHHSLRLSGGWQQKERKNVVLGSMLNFPRGYVNTYTEDFKIGTIDYSMPLCYPDWSLSYFVYLKRLSVNMFCDVAQNQYHVLNRSSNILIPHKDNLYSVGADLLADVNLIRFAFPINLGLRTSYIPETGNFNHSLLLSVTFY